VCRSTDNLSNENRLWRSVLGQAIYDIYHGDDHHRSEVLRWLKSPDFPTICELAEVHVSDTKQQLTALFALPKNLSIKYGKLLREKIMEDDG
jgi:hypothetical protein